MVKIAFVVLMVAKQVYVTYTVNLALVLQKSGRCNKINDEIHGQHFKPLQKVVLGNTYSLLKC